VHPVGTDGIVPMSLRAQVSKCTVVWGRVFLARPAAGQLRILEAGDQVEAAISIGGGVKFLMPRRMQLRVDFRAYMTPLPDQLFRPVGLYLIPGLLYDFVPLGGISYVF
jgi:hypothetical protein